LFGCSKDNLPPVADFDFEDVFDRYVLVNKSTDPNGDALTSTWKSSDNVSFFHDGPNMSFLLPDRSGNSTTDIK
jgi:hypothetical protein